MSVPEHLWRFPTADAIASLAARFGLPNTKEMQDWEWEVADPQRKEEFFDAYKSGDLSDDERFTIMETIIQSFEDSEEEFHHSGLWAAVLRSIEENLDLHIHTVWYWSDLENDNEGEMWKVTPFIRDILNKYKEKFA